MNDQHADKLIHVLEHIDMRLARLVSVQEQRLQNEINNMPPNVIQALIDLLNKFVALVNTDATNLAASEAARAAAQQSLTDLQAADASAAALVPAAQSAIDAANAAVPATPTP